MALGERGSRLFRAFEDRVDAAGLVILEEAARIADRLDKLDGLLCGEADVWCRLVHNTRTEDYEIKVDAALAEARQHAVALKQLLASLSVKDSDDGDDEAWLNSLDPSLRDAAG